MSDEVKKEQEVKEEKTCCCEAEKAEEKKECCCEAEKAEEKKECCCDAEKAEEKKECCCDAEKDEKDEKAEEKKEDTLAVKIGKSIARIVILTVICLGVLYFVFNDQIKQGWYENRDTQAGRDKIVEFCQLEEFKAKGYEYSVSYFDNGEGSDEGYKITISNKDKKYSIEFQVYITYDITKKDLVVNFPDGNKTINERSIWESALRNAGLENKSVKKAAPAAPAAPEAPAAPAAK